MLSKQAISTLKILKSYLKFNMTIQEIKGHVRIACEQSKLSSDETKTLQRWALDRFNHR